jgi:hypothetical protein
MKFLRIFTFKTILFCILRGPVMIQPMMEIPKRTDPKHRRPRKKKAEQVLTEAPRLLLIVRAEMASATLQWAVSLQQLLLLQPPSVQARGWQCKADRVLVAAAACKAALERACDDGRTMHALVKRVHLVFTLVIVYVLLIVKYRKQCKHDEELAKIQRQIPMLKPPKKKIISQHLHSSVHDRRGQSCTLPEPTQMITSVPFPGLKA